MISSFAVVKVSGMRQRNAKAINRGIWPSKVNAIGSNNPMVLTAKDNPEPTITPAITKLRPV